MRETISVADVRKICEVLVKEHGDVFETSIKCNQPVDLIKKIKNKKFMKAISDSYFTADTWGSSAPGVEEPDPIKLTDVNKTTTTNKNESTNKTTAVDKTPSTNKTNVTTKQTHQRTEPLTPTEINEISKMIADGISVDDIAKTLKIGKTSIGAVRNKSRYSSISDKYFKIVGLNIVSLKTNEVVGYIRGPRDKKTVDKKTNEKKSETKKKPTTKAPQPKTINTESTTSLVSEIRRLGVQLLMSMKITDLPEHIRVEIEKIIETEIDNMSLSEIASLGESK